MWEVISRRLEFLEAALAGFPDTAWAALYPQLEPLPQVSLAELITREQLCGEEPIGDGVLEKFVRRLRAVRSDLSEHELLELRVPALPGDQEVFLARLGKWRFELAQLRRRLD